MLASGIELGLEQPTVLLVEDEVSIRLLIADELRGEGIYVLEASNADEALTILDSSLPVHVLFTDVRMPGRIDGIGLTKLARNRRPEIKVIIASSRQPPMHARDAADVFICKPYDLGAVSQQVEKLLVQSGHAVESH